MMEQQVGASKPAERPHVFEHDLVRKPAPRIKPETGTFGIMLAL
jgi:hypothetical protein